MIMGNILEVSEVVRDNIFQEDFLEMKENNIIEFKACGKSSIAVLYGPNGTGKTSLARVLESKENTDMCKFSGKFNENPFSLVNNEFYVINDQISRNIIPGDTADYLMGENIKKEYDLKNFIDSAFEQLFKSDLPSQFKADFKISKVGNKLLTYLKNQQAKKIILDIVNTKNKGKNINRNEFITFIKEFAAYGISPEYDIEKYQFIINDYSETNSVIESLFAIDFSKVIRNPEVKGIEKKDDAINILNKYFDETICIICDNPGIDSHVLLENKKSSKEEIYKNLGEDTRKILDGIIYTPFLREKDPYKVKEILLGLIADGNIELVEKMKEEVTFYRNIVDNNIFNTLVTSTKGILLVEKYDEYQSLLKEQPIIEDEELLYIKSIISDNIDKDIQIKRDENNGNSFRILLSGQEFLGMGRENLHLSTGEQNFISLAFELLIARRTERKIIVIDDPISSFDSIYKNKIAFCIIKFLEGKNQLILTHNTDLIKLLEFQLQGCFNLYLFNNCENGNNGFIPVSNREKNLLLNMHNLITTFQKDLLPFIEDERMFLISMIPFMRGYSNISKNGCETYKKLSKIMHGYENTYVNISETYNELFGDGIFTSNYEISSQDILRLNLADIKILKSADYPLLNNTLRQTLVYYYLRMLLERELMSIFQIASNGNMKLHKIIQKAFCERNGDSEIIKNDKREKRVFFTSRKTLLNEFNHFEGNMNIFQPAIDISDNALKKEMEAILIMLVDVKAKYNQN